jgi:hypothetical protein
MAGVIGTGRSVPAWGFALWEDAEVWDAAPGAESREAALALAVARWPDADRVWTCRAVDARPALLDLLVQVMTQGAIWSVLERAGEEGIWAGVGGDAFEAAPIGSTAYGDAPPALVALVQAAVDAWAGSDPAPIRPIWSPVEIRGHVVAGAPAAAGGEE